MIQRCNKWYSLVCDYVERYNAFSDELPVFKPPAGPREFNMLESLWGIKLPDEFVSFYSFSNGFGRRKEGDDSVNWQFVPIEELPQFTKFQRDYFYDSHPYVARAFMPFIDFLPDGLGYVSEEKNVVTGQLWMFDDGARCELVSHAPDYDWRYFLRKIEGSIEEYLQR